MLRGRRTTSGLPQPAHLSDQLSPLRITASITCHSQTAYGEPCANARS